MTLGLVVGVSKLHQRCALWFRAQDRDPRKDSRVWGVQGLGSWLHCGKAKKFRTRGCSYKRVRRP